MQNRLHKYVKNRIVNWPAWQILLATLMLFLFATSLKAQVQQDLAKKIDIQLKGSSLKESLSVLENKSGVFFNVQFDILNKVTKKITLQANGITVKDALTQILENTDLRYRILNNAIVIEDAPKKINTEQKKTSPGKPGVLRGRIVDNENMEPIRGASIFIADKSFQTDTAGFFEISLPEDMYLANISYLGYKKLAITDIKVQAGKEIMLDLSMERNAGQISEVVVNARQIIETGTTKAVIDEIRLSRSVVSGIGKQQITMSQDRDAYEVVKRIPAVSVIDNRFIVVRGLNQRYNSVLLNNVFAPSFEANSRAFSFDILPSSMIDRIMIYKTAMPELPGDFAGGAIKIYTTSMPLKNTFNLTYTSSYNENATYQKFFEQPQGKLAWLSYDDGTYYMPKEAGPEIFTAERRVKTPFFNQNWDALQKTAPADMRINLDGSRIFHFSNNHKLGMVGSLGYSNTYQYDIQSRNDGHYLDNAYVSAYNFSDQVYSHSVRLNGLLNVNYQIGTNHTIELKNLYTHMADYEYMLRQGVAGPAADDGAGLKSGSTLRQMALDNNFRGVLNSQLTGDHAFKFGTKVNWTLGFTKSNIDQPDLRRRTQFVTVNEENEFVFTEGTGTPNAVSEHYLGRSYNMMPEETKTLVVNLTQKLGGKDAKSFLKAGIYKEKKWRHFTRRNLGMVLHPYDDNNDGQPDNDYLMGENSLRYDNYVGLNDLFAAYVAAEVPLLERYTLHTGVRMENNKNAVQTSAILTGEDFNINNNKVSWLPSVNLSRTLNKNSQLRFAYSKTLNRAEFRELALYFFLDMRTLSYIYGDPKLKTTVDIHNFDMRYEWYPSPGETVSIGAFHKRFINPIELTHRSSTSGITYFWGNAESARNYGFELDMNLRLSRILLEKGDRAYDALDKFSFLMNASYIFSEVEKGDAPGLEAKKRPLMGQSPYILNTSLNYDNSELGLMANVAYNVIGKRVFIVGNIYRPDVIELPRHSLDMTLSKRFKKIYEVKLGVQNLLNSRNYLIQDSDRDGKFRIENGPYQGWKDNKYLSWYDGTTISLGVGLRLGNKK